MKLSVLIPAYNEEAAIRSTILNVMENIIRYNTIIPFEVIVINDCSTDRTRAIVERIRDVKVINNPYNLGYGASLKKGLLKAKGEYILIIDGDGTYPPSHIPELLGHMETYDMVVGERDGTNVPLIRKPAKKILSIFANFLTGMKIPDLNSGMRIFRKDMAMKFFNLYPSGFSFTSTITLCALCNDYTATYVRINYNKRKGKSSIKSKDFFNFMELIMKIVMFFKPLKFFMIPGLALILLGIIYGIIQVISMTTGLGQFPVIMLIMGFQICLLGLIAEMIVKKNG